MLRIWVTAGLLVLLSALSPAHAGDVRVDGKLVSEATEGPPLEVQSAERVDHLNAHYLDGLAATELALAGHAHAGSGYANVVVVSPEGGDFTSIQAAIDSIVDASADHRYLVWIGPGVYEEAVTTKAGVDLQGAGQGLTIVRGAFYTADSTPDAGLVTVTGGGALGSLSIENEVVGALGTTALGFALVVDGGEPRLHDLTVRSSMACDLASTDFRAQAVRIDGGAARLSRVTLEAEVTGTEADGFSNAAALSAANGATPEVDDTAFSAAAQEPVATSSINVAVQVTGTSQVILRDSVLTAAGGTLGNYSISVPGPDPVARVAHSQVDGAVGGSGLVVCVGAYDATFTALGTDCL